MIRDYKAVRCVRRELAYLQNVPSHNRSISARCDAAGVATLHWYWYRIGFIELKASRAFRSSRPISSFLSSSLCRRIWPRLAHRYATPRHGTARPTMPALQPDCSTAVLGWQCRLLHSDCAETRRRPRAARGAERIVGVLGEGSRRGGGGVVGWGRWERGDGSGRGWDGRQGANTGVTFPSTHLPRSAVLLGAVLHQPSPALQRPAPPRPAPPCPAASSRSL